MEWKILTADTVLPEDVPMLFYGKENDTYVRGQCDSAQFKTLWIEDYGYASYRDYSHYCILEPPIEPTGFFEVDSVTAEKTDNSLKINITTTGKTHWHATNPASKESGSLD